MTKGRFPACIPVRFATWVLGRQLAALVSRAGVGCTKSPPRMAHPGRSGGTSSFLESGVNPAWSPDRTRGVSHARRGDPIFIADRNGNNRRQIYVDRPGIHNHYLTWSPDGRYIYFVGWSRRTKHLWRFAVPADGATAVPERITHHNRVSRTRPGSIRTRSSLGHR